MFSVIHNNIESKCAKYFQKSDSFSFDFIRLEFERQQREELEKLESKR